MLTKSGRIKLLKFVPVFCIGGTERHVVNLGNSLDPSRFDVHLACFKRQGPFLNEIKTNLTLLTEYTITSLYNHTTLREQFKFAQYVRRHRIHIVHTYGFYSNVFAIPAARLAGSPVIVASIRDTGDVWTPMQRRVQKIACRLADHVVVNAEAVKRQLLSEGYRPEKVTVIHNGIDLSRFPETRNRCSDRLHQELNLPVHAPLVAVLTRLVRVKGLEFFLEAAAMVARRMPEARFLIVGDTLVVDDDAYRRELESYALRLGLGQRVIFTSYRLDVPEILSEVAVSVLPSLSEGLSNALLESMAAGAPVVATRVGGNPEVIENGLTGFLVPPRDPAALAHAIGRLLENRELALRFSQAGRQRVAKLFSLEKMVRETEQLYLELLHNKKCDAVKIGSMVGGSA